MKKESRVLLHVRRDPYDFIAVIRGVLGIEHVRILCAGRDIEDLVSRIAGEDFFQEVRFIITDPPDLSREWAGALKRIGRSDMSIIASISGEVLGLVSSYIDIFGMIREILKKNSIFSSPCDTELSIYGDRYLSSKNTYLE
jgi:hypothetical protein